MNKNEVLNSSLIIVIYSIIFYFLIATTGGAELYSILYIPLKLYSIFNILSYKLDVASYWITLLPSILAPLLFVLVVKRR